MKILHTSDWHLGRVDRLEEQSLFIEELINICDENNIDLIIIAGDIYDTFNPPIDAEKLFFYAVKKLSLNGKRPIIVIAGNHDSGNRISSPKPLASQFGIILNGNFNEVIEPFKAENFEIIKSGKNFFEICINNENAVFLTIPYITEKSLNEVIFNDLDENEQQKTFSQKLKDIFLNLSKNFRKDTINIIVGHFFVIGGKETDSERKIQTIGGIYAVSPNIFPIETQYVALGHLHKTQKIKSDICDIYYSGSPIQYSKSEAMQKKAVLIVDIKPNSKCNVKKVFLTNYKPIEVWKCCNYADALDKCIKNCDKNCWVFLEINAEQPLMASQLKALYEYKKDIVNISINFDNFDKKVIDTHDIEKTIEDEFKDFYFNKKGVYPTDEILNLFLNILDEFELENFNETSNP